MQLPFRIARAARMFALALEIRVLPRPAPALVREMAAFVGDSSSSIEEKGPW